MRIQTAFESADAFMERPGEMPEGSWTVGIKRTLAPRTGIAQLQEIEIGNVGEEAVEPMYICFVASKHNQHEGLYRIIVRGGKRGFKIRLKLNCIEGHIEECLEMVSHSIKSWFI